jgi:hypothetical protein
MKRSPPDQDAEIRNMGKILQDEASRLAERLVECGADATSFFWPDDLHDFRRQQQVCIPSGIADCLLAVMLSLPARPRGRRQRNQRCWLANWRRPSDPSARPRGWSRQKPAKTRRPFAHG